MFILSEYEYDKCLIKTDYSEDKKGIIYEPMKYDLLVIKCGFDYRFDEITLGAIVASLNNAHSSTRDLEKGFQAVGDVSVMLFRKLRFFEKNCFPLEDQGKNYILLACIETGDDIHVYKPDFSSVANGGAGICQVPLSIDVVKLPPQRRGFLNLFASREPEYDFQYETCAGYSDGDIFYEVEGFYSDEEDRRLIIPVTQQAMLKKHICINTNGYSIKFGHKKQIKMSIKE